MSIKDIDMINDKVKKEIIKYAVKGKVKLIGSNSIRGLLFTNDIDIETDLQGSPTAIANYFKKSFKFTKSFFIDFKCGLDNRLVYDGDYSLPSVKKYVKNELIVPSMKEKILKSKGEEQIELIRSLYILRWTPKDIQKGYILLVDETKKTLEEALMDDTIIKLDFIVPVGDTFAEVSENYYFRQSRPSDKTLQKDLEDDIEYYSHTDAMKALKRLYSLLRFTNPESSKINLLEEFFNSWVGYLTKIKNDLLIIKQLIELKYITWSSTKKSLESIKQRLSNVKNIKIVPLNNIGQLTRYLDYIGEIINKNSKTFLKDIYI